MLNLWNIPMDVNIVYYSFLMSNIANDGDISN